MGLPLTVPPFDVIIDSQGYVFADQEQEKALFGNTPTFVSRQNTQGNYGDNQQDAWLTVTQNDWSLGEQQKHYRGNDEERSRRFWRGKAVDVRVPGEVSLQREKRSITFAANPKCAAADSVNDRVYFATSTNLYYTIYDGTITSSMGTHGLGAAPSRWGMAFDSHVYLSTTTGGTVGVRRWNGAAFDTWSATGADSLAVLNNTLYGFRKSAGTLVRYDTAGVATVLYTWQTAGGNAHTFMDAKLVPFGGKLLILHYLGAASSRKAELWLFDGTAPAKIAEFPFNFRAYDMEVLNGAVLVSGAFEKYVNSTLNQKPAICFYKDGQQGLLWQAERYAAGTALFPAMCLHDGGIVFSDPIGLPNLANARIVYYDPESGSVSTYNENTLAGSNAVFSGASTFFLVIPNSTTGTDGEIFPHNADNAATGIVDSSLIDFDSSLPKIVRGVRADFEVTDTGTLDLAYRVNDLEGSYTTLQTGATSGTEYVITTPVEGTTHRSVSVRATLNRGATTTSQVKLKKIAVRGLPVLPAYKKRTYVLYLGGVDGESPVKLRDGTHQSLDGKQMALNLQTAAGRTSPFTITDQLGSFTGRIDEGGLEMIEVKPEVWVARVRVREV